MTAPLSVSSRARGALYGLAIGDALAMPAHWYYNRSSLRNDYGLIDRFLAPKNPHPESILWRSSYEPLNEKGEILHDQAIYWGQRGIHYHQFLEAGGNTLTLQLAIRLQQSLLEKGSYDFEDYTRRYLDFFATPGRHRDTYVEESHREFFLNYARGRKLARCAVEGKHIGGLPGIIPIALRYADEPVTACRHALQHLSLTHRGNDIAGAAGLILDILLPVLAGADLFEVIRDRHARQTSAYLGFPLGKWLTEPDENIIGPHLSPACYLADSVPATIYLAAKYHDAPREGLIANTMLGGDNVHRGAILGALIGAANGEEAWPIEWREGLLVPPPLLEHFNEVAELSDSTQSA
jgi:ADP-ribosyl-[dinitrogen reductase] hydrolase